MTDDNSVLINAQESLNEHAKRYLKKVWISKGCRFVANRRLREKNHASQLVISLLSVGVIAASISLLVIDSDSKKLTDFINVLAINASVFILVLSNLEFAKNYSVEAERMLHGAQVLSEIHDDLELCIKSNDISKDSLFKIIDHYNQVLKDFKVNHEDIDYRFFQCDHPKHFPLGRLGFVTRIFRKFEYFWHVWGLYMVCITIPPILIYAAIRYVPNLTFFKPDF